MLLHPNKYDKEWRHIISLLIHFSLVKNEYEARHLELVEEFKENTLKLEQITNLFTELIDRKCHNERRKVEALAVQGELTFRCDEVRAETEISQIERDQMLLVNEQLAAEEAALLAELHSLEQDGEAIKRKNEESLEMIVSSPEKVSEEREVAAEELKLILE